MRASRRVCRSLPIPIAVLLALACTRAAPVAPAPSDAGSPRAATAEASRPSCLDRRETRNAYFGDLHIHTGLSLDAYTFHTTATPDDGWIARCC